MPLPMAIVTPNILRIPFPKFDDGNDVVTHIGRLAKVCVMNGEDNDAHKLQYFPTTLQGKNANWFTYFETTNLVATWGEVQRAFISRYNDVHNKRQAIVALREVKQWKHEIVKDYFDNFLQLCVVIPQQLYDVYRNETFREGLKKKLKLAIIGMPKTMIVEVANFTKEIE
jgi:hypothetical protein